MSFDNTHQINNMMCPHCKERAVTLVFNEQPGYLKVKQLTCLNGCTFTKAEEGELLEDAIDGVQEEE